MYDRWRHPCGGAARSARLWAPRLGWPRPGAAHAQTGYGASGGSLSGLVEYTLVRRSEGSGARERVWASAIVLWRLPPLPDVSADTSPGARAALDARWAAAERRYREVTRAAEDSGRVFVGGMRGDVIHDAAIDREARTLWVHGRPFEIPRRDSALVVMVDLSGAPECPAAIAGFAFIPAALPEEFWPKNWMGGDTLFFVAHRRGPELLGRALRANAAVRAFLDR